jgi:hypothetical protein
MNSYDMNPRIQTTGHDNGSILLPVAMIDNTPGELLSILLLSSLMCRETLFNTQTFPFQCLDVVNCSCRIDQIALNSVRIRVNGKEPVRPKNSCFTSTLEPLIEAADILLSLDDVPTPAI